MRDDDRKRTTGASGATTVETEHENRDRLTGEAGSHPVGTGVGAATGGTVGAVVGGAVGGPVGAMVGAAVGGIAGGLAGKGISESVNPTEESAFWRDHYDTRPYVEGRNYTYEDLEPAYRYGWESRTRYPDRSWSDVEGDLERGWNERYGTIQDTPGAATGATTRPTTGTTGTTGVAGTGLAWTDARLAVHDAWNRVDARHRFNTEEDEYWRTNFANRPYAKDRTYDQYRPALRYGWESAHLHEGRNWEDAEPNLRRGWERNRESRSEHHSTWDEVKHAVKDGWDRMVHRRGGHDRPDRVRKETDHDLANTTGYPGTSFTGSGATTAAGAAGAGMAGHEHGPKGMATAPTASPTGHTTTAGTLNTPAGSNLTGSGGGTITSGKLATGRAGSTGLAGGQSSATVGATNSGWTVGTGALGTSGGTANTGTVTGTYSSSPRVDDGSRTFSGGKDREGEGRDLGPGTATTTGSDVNTPATTAVNASTDRQEELDRDRKERERNR